MDWKLKFSKNFEVILIWLNIYLCYILKLLSSQFWRKLKWFYEKIDFLSLHYLIKLWYLLIYNESFKFFNSTN